MAKRKVSVEDNGYELKGINEWSLEFNVMAELKQLVESVWMHVHGTAPYRYVDFPTSTGVLAYPIFPIRSRFLMFKPHHRDENTLGYDIHLKPMGEDSHSQLIQFKRHDFPNPTQLVQDKQFLSGQGKTWTDYYTFEINNNKPGSDSVANPGYNQHLNLLKYEGLADCMYAFPLIKDKTEMERHAGRLLLRTKFIKAGEIEDKAEERLFDGIANTDERKLLIDDFWKTPHRVLIEEKGTSWVLNYYYYYYDHNYFANLGNLVTDLVVLNLKRAIPLTENYPKEIRDAFFFSGLAGFLLNLASYCGIKPNQIGQSIPLLSNFKAALDQPQYVEDLQSMDELMTQQGTAIWGSVISALKLSTLNYPITVGNMYQTLLGYKFKVIKPLKEELHVSIDDDSLQDLSAYTF